MDYHFLIFLDYYFYEAINALVASDNKRKRMLNTHNDFLCNYLGLKL